MTSTGWTRPRPNSRCHRRLTIVRVKRALLGWGATRARRSRRCALGTAPPRAASAREQKPRRRRPPGRLVAAVDLQRPLGDHRRQAVGVVQLPGVDETVVARGALEVGPEEDLRDVLRELQLRHLAGVDVAAPLDALDEPLRLWRRVDQLADELVVGRVVQQRRIEPGGDLLAAAVDVAGALVVIAE